ncbi:hypothetical protein [Stenotrophomonas sp.]|uniref:hypothetical protein n=1 Tax=Stenotrophomonas sp. TaxID=69392 RepID=UPI0028AFB353|nr:hypothetical protein [Stenotrophomonas sp.]
MSAPAARTKRNPLARFKDQQLRDELDRRAKEEGKPKTVWVVKRSEFLTQKADELEKTVETLEEELMPRGPMRPMQIARIRALKDQVRRNRAFAKLAKADEDAAEAQAQSNTSPSSPK